MKTIDEVYSTIYALLSPERCIKQCEIDSDCGCCFDFDSNTKLAYQIGACYAIQVIRQELIAGKMISDELAAGLDAIQYRLQ